MNAPTTNAMRNAFAKATQDTPVKARSSTYAMIRSALSRRLGTKRQHSGWSVSRSAKRV